MKVFLPASLTILLAFGLLTFFLQKQSQALLLKARDIRTQTNQINADTLALGEAKEALQDFSEEQKILEQAIPKTQDIFPVLTALASQHGVTVTLSTPASPTTTSPSPPPQEGQQEVIILMRAVTSSTTSLQNFLADLESGKLIASIQKFRLSHENDASASVNADIELTVTTQ